MGRVHARYQAKRRGPAPPAGPGADGPAARPVETGPAETKPAATEPDRAAAMATAGPRAEDRPATRVR
jgi:hypothetical protein